MLKLTSSSFRHGGEIPTKYTCEGPDVSPPLMWEGIPESAKSLVLIIDDPDAPDPKAPKMTWVHWLGYNIPTNISGIAENATAHGLPDGVLQGENDWHNIAYGGPCPPIGQHRYFHKLYAMDTFLQDLSGPTKAQLESAMQGHIIEKAELLGVYQKSN